MTAVSAVPPDVLPSKAKTCSEGAGDTGCTVVGPVDLLDDAESSMLDAAGNSTSNGVDVRAAALFASASLSTFDNFRLVTIALTSDDAEADDEGASSPGASLCLLWAPSSSPSIEAPFIMLYAHYAASIALAVRPGTSIRTMFAVSVAKYSYVKRCFISHDFSPE